MYSMSCVHGSKIYIITKKKRKQPCVHCFPRCWKFQQAWTVTMFYVAAISLGVAAYLLPWKWASRVACGRTHQGLEEDAVLIWAARRLAPTILDAVSAAAWGSDACRHIIQESRIVVGGGRRAISWINRGITGFMTLSVIAAMVIRQFWKTQQQGQRQLDHATWRIVLDWGHVYYLRWGRRCSYLSNSISADNQPKRCRLSCSMQSCEIRGPAYRMQNAHHSVFHARI